MNAKRSVMVVTLLSLALAACAPPPPPPPDPAAVKAAIEAANTKFIDAMLKGDVATMKQNYAGDAIVMMPGGPAMRGLDGISKGFDEFLKSGKISNVTLKTDDVQVAGDYAIETGSGGWDFAPPKGKAMHDQVKYVTVWKKQADGSWKIVRDINNSDLASPTPVK